MKKVDISGYIAIIFILISLVVLAAGKINIAIYIAIMSIPNWITYETEKLKEHINKK